MDRWEYRVFRFDANSSELDLKAMLDPLGQEGWEAVSVAMVVGVHGFVLLKRRLL